MRLVSKKWFNILMVTCVTFMLTVTSIGGAYVGAVYAAPTEDEQTNDQPKDVVKKDDKVLGGLLLVGLVSMLSKGSDHKKGTSGAGKAVPSQTSPSIPSIPATGTPVSKGNMSAEELQLVSLINAERTKQGLAALKANNPLGTVGRVHSQDMADNNYFDHYNQQGKNPFDRMRAAGISFSTGGENIAINTSVSGAHNAFMNSSGHRANILSANYTEVGVGIIHDGTRIYVAEEFIGR
jgi:uncharacterized protein YkwD